MFKKEKIILPQLMEVSLIGKWFSCRVYCLFSALFPYTSASTYSMKLHHIKTRNLLAKLTNYNQVLVSSDSLRKQFLEKTAISKNKFCNLIAKILIQLTCYLLKQVVQ